MWANYVFKKKRKFLSQIVVKHSFLLPGCSYFQINLALQFFPRTRRRMKIFLCLLEEEIRWLHIWGFLENQTFVKVCLEKGTGVFPFAISTIIKIRNDLPFPCRQSFILLEGKCKSWCGHILFVSTAKEDTFLTPDIFTFFFLFWKETYRTLKRVHFWWSDMPQMKLILKRPFTLFTFNATFLAHHQTER